MDDSGGQEAFRQMWQRLRERAVELEVAAAQREVELERLETTLWKRARILDKRQAELAKRSKEPGPRPAASASPIEGGEVRAAEEAGAPDSAREPSDVAWPGGGAKGRIPTRVAGLDEALGGGIPAGHVVILEGAPGTMKSSLGFWILAQNALSDQRRGVYVTCEESSGSLLRQASSLGIPSEPLKDLVSILDVHLLSRMMDRAKTDWLAALKDAIETVRKRGGLDLLVLDSLASLEVLARFADRRQDLFRLFEWLRGIGATTLVIAERPDYIVGGHVLQGRYDENFLADGVLHLRLHPISDVDMQRRVRIVKMRGTKHETGYLALHVDRGQFEAARALGG
jgi:KaiC/GvpD/RAD55 family RecA-like ATPase